MTKKATVKRGYVSALRAAAAGKTHTRIVDAASRLLREADIVDFSLEAVAKAAGVTRLTVYKQFGSRRGLLEAVFDKRASEGGLGRIPEAMALSNPRQALERLVEIFCAFWSADEGIGRLHDATVTDAEFAQALAARNERRRVAIKALVGRIASSANIGSAPCRDVVDLLFGLTSYAMFRMLSTDRRPDAVCRIVQSACAAALGQLTEPG